MSRLYLPVNWSVLPFICMLVCRTRRQHGEKHGLALWQMYSAIFSCIYIYIYTRRWHWLRLVMGLRPWFRMVGIPFTVPRPSPTHWAQSQMHIVHIDPARPIQNAMLMPTKEKSHRRGRERESRRYADELSTVAVAMHPGARSDRYSSAKNLPIASEQRRIGWEEQWGRQRAWNRQITFPQLHSTHFPHWWWSVSAGFRGHKRERNSWRALVKKCFRTEILLIQTEVTSWVR